MLRTGGDESAQLCGFGQQRVTVRGVQLGERLYAQCLVTDLPRISLSTGSLPSSWPAMPGRKVAVAAAVSGFVLAGTTPRRAR